MSRHSSIDALRERYQRSRIQPQTENVDQNSSSSKQISNSPVTTVYEEEEEEEDEDGDDEPEEKEYEDDAEEDDNYSMYSSSSSIPDENINFDLVYALHTFVATVDGQASVVKGDAMTLLDDSNSYWWLIRALKASEVGYIPAENIETPFERLARLNKHRNVEVTSLDQLQHYSKHSTETNRSRVKKKVKVSKELACQLQVIVTDEDHESIYEETFEVWDEEMSSEAYKDGTDDETEQVDKQEERKKSNKKKDKKYSPFLNPDFNKPISNIAIVKDTDKQQDEIPVAVSASLPTPVIEPSVEEPALDSTTTITAITTNTDVSSPLSAIDEPEKTIEDHQQQQQQQQTMPEEQPPLTQQHSTQQVVVTGLKRLLSIGKKNKAVSTPLVISNPTAIEDTQYHVLRIFSGNINVGALFSTVAVTPDMSADQLLKLALQKFHIPLLDNSNKSNDGIEYYLTVKSMDSDEITLSPQDKPLAIFESLSDHLTTPMPSLTYIKRLSMEQPTIKVTRVGVSKARQRAKARFGEDSVIRFSLHKRIKRTIETSGQIYVKISYYAENKKHHHHLLNTENNNTKISTMGLIRKSSLLRVDQQVQQQQQMLMQQKAKQERIDKLVAVATTTHMISLTNTALEKFHMMNEDTSLYYMSLSVNGKETPVNSNRTVSDVLSDPELIPKGTTEKLFVLRKRTNVSLPPSPVQPALSASDSTSGMESPNNHHNGNRFMRFLKQDTKEVHTLVRPASVERMNSNESSTGSVLRRLDQAIQSLENDKRHLDHRVQTTARTIPMRSNSLSTVSSYRPNHNNNANLLDHNLPRTKIAPAQQYTLDSRRLPTRSSSLKVNSDVFDASRKSGLSNMDDLQLELKRIGTSHNAV